MHHLPGTNLVIYKVKFNPAIYYGKQDRLFLMSVFFGQRPGSSVVFFVEGSFAVNGGQCFWSQNWRKIDIEKNGNIDQ